MRTALIIGAGALAVYFLMRSQVPAVAVPGTTYTTGAGAGGIFGAFASKPPASIPTPGPSPLSLSGAQALSNAGCSAIAGSKGVPTGIASDGCKLFGMLTPLGFAATSVKLVEKIPYVGGVVSTAGGKIEGAAKSAYHSVTSFLGF